MLVAGGRGSGMVPGGDKWEKTSQTLSFEFSRPQPGTTFSTTQYFFTVLVGSVVSSLFGVCKQSLRWRITQIMAWAA